LAIAVSINSYIVSIGFGRHKATISDDNLKTISLNTILVAAFGIMATTLSKSSFAITLHRISTNKWMKYFLIFVIVTINLSMNLVWIFGFAKCTPLKKVWDSTVPGTCWDKTKLVKFQLFAACKVDTAQVTDQRLTASDRLFCDPRFRVGVPSLADPHGTDNAAS
jgi:hypothetical protein